MLPETAKEDNIITKIRSNFKFKREYKPLQERIQTASRENTNRKGEEVEQGRAFPIGTRMPPYQ
jgi:hypothetical protein